MTECLETWKRALEDRGMRISRPKPQFIDFKCGQDNSQGRDPVKILGEELQKVQQFKCLGSSVEETGGTTHINFIESDCSMEKLEEMQWSEGNGLQNYGQTNYVVWCIDMGDNERRRSTTRSK